MRIVIGLHDFATFGGTETYTLTLADELIRLGHDVVVHPASASPGPITAVARDRGIAVVDAVERLPPVCDAVLAQDAASAYVLAERYPDARRLLIAHSDYYSLQSPPQLAGVCDAVVVLNDRVGRHAEALGASVPVIRLRQPVDLKRFGATGGTPERARRVLVLGNYLRGPAAEAVAGACRDAGLDPVLSGANTTPTHTPEQAMADVEVVIGLGRCVVEALAARRAAYVYGITGADGWVTPERYAVLEADGFGGTATDAVIDRARLAADLAAWHPEMGPLNRQLAFGHHDAVAHAVELVAELQAVRPHAGPPRDHAGELARLVRLEWQSWSRYTGALTENRDLREALDAERAEAQRVREEAQRAREETQQAREEAQRAHEETQRAHEEAQRLHEDAARVREQLVAAADEARGALADAHAQHAATLIAAAEAAATTEAALVHEIQRLEAFRSTRRYRVAATLGRPPDALRRWTGGGR